MGTRLPVHGFTLVEAVVVIIITGIIAAVTAKFIVKPVEGYSDLTRRVQMTDTADLALRRMGRDLHRALPNSVRIRNGTALEFLSTSMGGRYRVGLKADGTGDILDFSHADTSFDLIGPSMTFAATTLENQNEIVIYNLGIPGADAYEGNTGATHNRRVYKNGTGGVVTNVAVVSSEAFPFDSPGHRFQVVDTPVSYVCDLTAGTLTRYWGYTIAAAQAVPPLTTYKAVLASNVSNCVFNYAAVNERNSLVAMQISITQDGETITLYHEVHVSNVP